MVERVNKLHRATRDLTHRLRRDPTPDELAQQLDIPVAKVKWILRNTQEVASIEVMEMEDTSDGDWSGLFVASHEGSHEILAECMNRERRQAALRVLGGLHSREQTVIKMRFGIPDGYESTLEEVGQVFRLTRERVRQIEEKALKKLQHPTRTPFLKPHLQ